jgi:hypothetical protein
MIHHLSERKIHDATHKFQSSSNSATNISRRADQAIARIRAKHGSEYNGDAVDAETGWTIADARVMQQQDFQLGMARLQSTLISNNAFLSTMNRFYW